MRMIALGLLLACVHCGSQNDLVAPTGAGPGRGATGTLLSGGAVLCSATLVAPDVVVTSGRCARVALGAPSVFRLRQGTQQTDTAIRQGHVLSASGALVDPAGPATAAEAQSRHPAVRTAGQKAAIRGIQRHCHVRDMFALTRSVGVRGCLDTVPAALLQKAGGMGLAHWQDVGWLGLQDAVAAAPAQVATGDIPELLALEGHVRRVGVRQVRGLRASPMQVYEHAYRLYESDTDELHTGPERGGAPADMGSALWMETFASGTSGWLLVGVASRPFVAHSDTSAGIIFSRIDTRAPLMRAAIRQLTLQSAISW